MRAEFLPFSPPLIGREEIDEVLDTLRSDWITTGPKTTRFEDEFAVRFGSPGALAVSSCTDALQIALASLGVGPGDAVFTTTLTFCSTVHVVEHVGATPVLVDVESDTLNLDPARLSKAIEDVAAEGRLTPRVILPVHYAGHPCAMDEIDRIAQDYGLAIVEDAAHSLPAAVGGRRIGDPSAPPGVVRATAFSFYATKNLTTAEGGMLTGPPELLDEARLWALHGMSRDAWSRYGQGGSWFYEVVRPGFKCNMTDIQAAIGIQQLRKLDALQARRHEVAARYDAAFAELPEIVSPSQRDDVEASRHLYPIRIALDALAIDRAEFIAELNRRNIGTSVHFIPVHVHPYYRDRYAYEPEQFPVAWSEYARLVSLPIHPRMSNADVDDVVAAVTEVVALHRR